MWFMSIRSDIYVFLCRGFGLGECIWCVGYSFYNGGYLSGENLGVLAF